MNITERILRAKADYDEVYDAGKQAEHKVFMDGYLKARANSAMDYMFSGAGWSKENWYPTIDMQPTQSVRMFVFGFKPAVPGEDIDLVERLDECGVSLDFSKSVNMSEMFHYSYVGRIGVIDTKSCTAALNSTFGYLKRCHTIDKIIVYENTKYSNTFQESGKLKRMIVEGTIAQNGFNVKWSTKLDKESITSIVNALSNTTSGLTVTFSKTAVNNAFGIDVDDPTTYPEGSEWYELRNSRSNWTFAYK
jgi:hypothetical protein